ncbi:MAG: hypothetical protein P9M13_01620 [Candidatus Ancaeobacter aquaticus]|nr:hypothetical protein [Candidatus Ancaeobacter aquaticus]
MKTIKLIFGACLLSVFLCTLSVRADATLLHEFDGSVTDGRQPQADLTLIGNTMYSMTGWGGANNKGTIFSVDTNGSNFTLLHSLNVANLIFKSFLQHNLTEKR